MILFKTTLKIQNPTWKLLIADVRFADVTEIHKSKISNQKSYIGNC